MGMRFDEHPSRTESQDVLSLHEARVALASSRAAPASPHCRTPITSYSLKITPADHFINWQQDPYSNRLARLVFPNKTTEFCVEVDLVAEMTVINPFDFFLEQYAEECPFEYDRGLRRVLSPYRKRRHAGPKLEALIQESRT